MTSLSNSAEGKNEDEEAIRSMPPLPFAELLCAQVFCLPHGSGTDLRGLGQRDIDVYIYNIFLSLWCMVWPDKTRKYA